ncbi:MAG: carbamoyltransferase HypF [Bacteroidota bacterium]
MNTWHIHIQGQVQGVGFRPFVYGLAKEYEINGWVNNTVNGVHVAFNADEKLAQQFEKELKKRAPRLSRITTIELSQIQEEFFDNFQIIHSDSSGESNLLLTPDFAICSDCKEELVDHSNRRHQYPFITCTNCGPRFSIVTKLPYDRANTTMDNFKMCPTCRAEYEDSSNRRYYSQTNSCPNCKIQLTLFDKKGALDFAKEEDILDQIVKFWQAGKVVAIKGIGGYLLTCDASNRSSILELRKRKHRPTKPLAVVIPDNYLQQDVFITKQIHNEISPIVLLDFDLFSNKKLIMEALAPGLNQLGAMLPYTPLYQLLLRKFDNPVVATSGNISNSPIIFQDKKALQELFQIADYVLINNRDITIPQDDSVIRFSPFKKQKIILRRSRGLAPTYINSKLKLPQQNILATGAMLKSTFSLLNKQNIYVSQYLGDLEHFDTQENFKLTLQHFLDLFQTQPEIILSDAHEHYPSTQIGQELSRKFNIPIQKIQHHMAHFGAILGEHHLLQSNEPILGVIWDGTGLGDDGQIWGGEFFKYENFDFLRCYHFDYFDFILGDKMPKEPRVSALSACWDVMGAEEILKAKFTPTEWKVYAKFLEKGSPLQTSSVGRIFDAVASLLGILDKQTYEGEAAMQLERMALAYFNQHGLDFSSSYFQEGAHYYRIPTKSLMTNIVIDLRKGKPKDFIAAKFHFSLMKIIQIVANNLKVKKIALSGGVFQNALLVDLIQHHLPSHFELYVHQDFSPNDENISFGQLICYQIRQYRKLFYQSKTKEKCV